MTHAVVERVRKQEGEALLPAWIEPELSFGSCESDSLYNLVHECGD